MGSERPHLVQTRQPCLLPPRMETASEERPHKRARTQREVESSSPIERSAKYWFRDGNIILQVESTQFRLSQGVLAMHSPIFRDMFSLPLPHDEPLVDKCPIVVLSGDRSEDWTYLLDAMFPKEYLSEQKPTLEQLSGVLRLSQKYDIAHFRQGCLRRLKCEYPSTLAEFDKDADNWMYIDVPEGSSPNLVAAQVINLAREIGIWSILPTAFYSLASGDVPDDPSSLTSNLHNLQDGIAVLAGRMVMMRSYLESPLKWLDPNTIPCDACTQIAECTAMRTRLLAALGTRPAIVAAFFEVLQTKSADYLCTACDIRAREVCEEAKQEYWNKLPSYFGLPDWEELKRMDVE
ncbi:BTB domain-containing protein [Mycena chlorophos]|uniref:BTB domain-containing protein n=1 Tax=Mycena chlorophos TaxID=658473 RepID=A0A8H6VZY8_MYCCL|nr:BTB domain-containing protein [Mycena chlorophos]